MLKIVINTITIISLCLLIVLLNVTAPSWAGPLGILAIFILAYCLSLGIVTYLIFWGSMAVSYFSRPFVSRKPINPLEFKKSYYFATVFAAAPIILIGLQSVSSVGFYEALLILIFVVIGCVYVSKKTK
jgi:hypothetical protein